MNKRNLKIIGVLILLYFIFTKLFKPKKVATGTTGETENLDRYKCIGGTTGNLCAVCIDPLDPECTTLTKCQEICLGSPAPPQS